LHGRVATLYGARGQIVDTDGTVLATSTSLYDVQIDPASRRRGSTGRMPTATRSRDRRQE
jgi:cell division protein FtsI/penicillin-binding protein 2